MQGSQGEWRLKLGCVTAQIPPEELEFRGDPDNRKDVMANRKRIQARPHPDWLSIPSVKPSCKRHVLQATATLGPHLTQVITCRLASG